MNRTIEDIQKDIELLGIKGGYDIEQLLTPQDCRRLSYEIERLNNIIKELEEWLYDNTNYEEYDRVEKDTFNYVIKKIEELRNEEK